ncbi:unnamed protein product [Aphanomyces euteiches]|uniref:Uncharacterized protein n=1 Tax=Aphanomyces euteiches TaxID=100861 RepID=A0A6G0XP09_9STRA|nr:hypothetical protein Ae201684_002822 [Aphanomyces euteiches]KAH9092811.1 hypothetical protein Ae201684P_008479 [Aphanomyces euteiches]KAH9157487.1 hypothetical protein AeRB84_000686 [Aphanomyces euteiches]
MQPVDMDYDDDDEEEMESQPTVQRRRFFKSGLSTYEEFYSRNETGRRLGRYSLHVKLNTERPTITLLLSNQHVDSAMPCEDDENEVATMPKRRQRCSSDPEVMDATGSFKGRSHSDDIFARASSFPEVVRPKAITTERFSFFRHRSLPRTSSWQQDSSLSESVPVVEASVVSADSVRPSFPLHHSESLEDLDTFPVIKDDLKPFDQTSPTHETSPSGGRESLLPRDSSFSADPSYQPVAIRSSVSNNVNVVKFVSGFKNTKTQRGSFRSSLDSRPSLDSVRKSARNKKQSFMSQQEQGLNKRLRDARNRIPLEFRDELAHLLEKPYVPKPKTTSKRVQFASSNDVFVFESPDDDDDDGATPQVVDDIVMLTDGDAEKVYIVELDEPIIT